MNFSIKQPHWIPRTSRGTSAIVYDKTNVFYILLICLSYLTTQLLIIPNTIITADEFVFMRHLLDYTRALPYQDFLPYKSVFGHYLLAIPLYFSHSLLAPIFYVKMEIALINTVCLGLAMHFAMRLFNKRAVLLATLAILANQFSLFYMSDLRVDMLAAWFCLFSALAVLQQRICLAGILIGIAFLISQKALWYVLALNGAMCISGWAFSSYRLRSLFIFNSSAAAILALYLLFWSLVTSPAIVLSNFFYDAYIQAGINYYLEIYAPLWLQMLSHGPMLFLLWPFTFIMLFDKKLNSAQLASSVFCLCFTSIALILFINYKQAFPYNFVFTLPAFFIGYAAFFTWLRSTRLSTPFFYVFFIATAILLPFYSTSRAINQFDGTYQQAMIQTTAELTKNGGDYIAGVPLLYNKEQPIAGIKNLISPQIAYLTTADSQLEPLLLSSIYLTATTAPAVLDDLERSKVKVFINNYRTRALPDTIQQYIHDHYQHYYGSIYLYAPTISAQQLNFNLKFTATYRLEAQKHAKITIDGKRRIAGQVIQLTQGDHLSTANANYRLVLVPDMPIKLDKRFEKDDWQSTL